MQTCMSRLWKRKSKEEWKYRSIKEKQKSKYLTFFVFWIWDSSSYIINIFNAQRKWISIYQFSYCNASNKYYVSFKKSVGQNKQTKKSVSQTAKRQVTILVFGYCQTRRSFLQVFGNWEDLRRSNEESVFSILFKSFQ